MAENFDTRYFQTEAQETERAVMDDHFLSVGERCLNNEEFEAWGEMQEVIRKLGLDVVGFSHIDDDTGAEIVIEPPRSRLQEALLELIHETYAPLIAAAR